MQPPSYPYTEFSQVCWTIIVASYFDVSRKLSFLTFCGHANILNFVIFFVEPSTGAHRSSSPDINGGGSETSDHSRSPSSTSKNDSDHDPEEKLIQELISIRERDKRAFEEIATKGHKFVMQWYVCALVECVFVYVLVWAWV